MSYLGSVFHPGGEIGQFASSVGEFVSSVTQMSSNHRQDHHQEYETKGWKGDDLAQLNII